jgi:hypothetical protein|tara:strand:+ start:314 stop:856 length:543 start_codon:yes stop_codon:yes gene_type:complete
MEINLEIERDYLLETKQRMAIEDELKDSYHSEAIEDESPCPACLEKAEKAIENISSFFDEEEKEQIIDTILERAGQTYRRFFPDGEVEFCVRVIKTDIHGYAIKPYIWTCNWSSFTPSRTYAVPYSSTDIKFGKCYCPTHKPNCHGKTKCKPIAPAPRGKYVKKNHGVSVWEKATDWYGD